MENQDYTLAQVFKVGHRVELHPGTDMWARGARFGYVTSIQKRPDDERGDVYVVRLDNAPARKRYRYFADRLRFAK